MVANKSDVVRIEDISEEDKELLKPLEENNIPLLSMSTLSEEGVSEVKLQVSWESLRFFYKTIFLIGQQNGKPWKDVNVFLRFQACEALLAYRIENKAQTKKLDGILNRLHVAIPKPRDDKERLPFIPGGDFYLFFCLNYS